MKSFPRFFEISLLLLISIKLSRCFKTIPSFLFDGIDETLGYGESCQSVAISKGLPSVGCNVRESLACINQTCQCSVPLKMVYDTNKGLCVGRAGQPCVHHPSELGVSSNKRNQCTTYSTCEKEGKNSTCKCWTSFYQKESGACVKRRGYLQKCNRNEHCDSRKGYACNKDLGVCDCDSKVTIYNPDAERCVGLPNKECANAYRECTDNYKCKAGLCKCKYKEVEEATNGTMVCDPYRHKFGKPCGRFRGTCGDEEQSNLRCLNGKCRCKNPDYQTYDYDRRVCVSKIGGPCSLNPLRVIGDFRNGTINSKFNNANFPFIQCIPYAECVENKHFSANATKKKKRNKNKNRQDPIVTNDKGVCECGQDYIETKEGSCTLPYGSACDTSSRNKKDLCMGSLKCVNNACGCQNEMDVYEPETGKCAQPVGSVCLKKASCVKRAECFRKPREKKNKLPGRCRCRGKARATRDGSCA